MMNNKTIQKLKSKIQSTEWENKVFVAGGYCRDKILGYNSKDIDLLIDAPDGGLNFAIWLAKETGVYKEDSNPVLYPTYGTSKIRVWGDELECVMPRSEEYTSDSRKPSVQQSTLLEDVLRRDFTINTILLNVSSGQTLDLTERGMLDMEEGVIRTVLEPSKTFFDDPLRMLRAVRQSAKYGFKIDETTVLGIKENAYRLGGDNKYGTAISIERVNDEFTKMLLLDKPSLAMNMLVDLGLMEYIIPELLPLIGLTQNKYHKWDVWGHTMNVLDNTKPTLITRLAGLLHDIGKSKTKSEDEKGVHFYKHEIESEVLSYEILRRLKYPLKVIDEVGFICLNHMLTKSFGDDVTVKDKSLRKFFDRTWKYLDNLLDVIHADNVSHSDEHNMPNQVAILKKSLERIVQVGGVNEHGRTILPIDGNDIMSYLDISPSPMVKELIELSKKICYSNPLIEKENLLKQVGGYYRNLTEKK